MNFIFSTLNSLFDLLFWPFRGLSPWWVVIFLSVVTAVLMLLVFRYFSNQQAIRRAKDRLGAHLLEVRLFQDQPGVVARAYLRLLGATGGYLLHSLRPLAVVLLPLILILAQMELRLGREFVPGMPVLVKGMLADGASLDTADLRVPDGVSITAPALRIPESHEIDWRIEALRPGEFKLEIGASGATEGKEFVVPVGLERVSPLRTSSILDQLLYPGEPSLSGAVKSIEILYPQRSMTLLGYKIHWLIPFFVLSLVFGYAFKGVMGVEF